MKTLVLLSDLEGAVGGIAAFNRLFVQALTTITRSAGDTLTVLVLHDSPDREHRGFEGNRLPFAYAARQAARGAGRIFYGHVHLASLLWGLSHAQNILIAHGLEVWRPLSWARRVALRRMDAIWAVSRYTAERIVHVQGGDRRRCFIFPNALKWTSEAPNRSRSSVGLPEGKMLLTVSRLSAKEPYKQIELVIKALPGLLEENPNLFYVVAGDGSDRPRLERISRALGLQGRVIFAGSVSDERLAVYYQACDIFVLPSLEEGFGIVFLEAMLHRKPCVGAQAGGIPEVIVDEKTGLLSVPRDVSSLRVALQRLLCDARLRETMGQAGRERLEQDFTFERFTERMRHLLSEDDASRWRLAA